MHGPGRVDDSTCSERDGRSSFRLYAETGYEITQLSGTGTCGRKSIGTRSALLGDV